MTADPQLQHDPRCTTWRSTDPTECTCRDEQGYAPAERWIDGPLLPFDLETTGPDPLTARIVTATVIDIRPGTDPAVTNWLSDVDGEEIPDGAAAVHGITTEIARRDGRPYTEVVAEVLAAVEKAWANGVPVVGHNVGSYDLTVLSLEAGRAGLTGFTEPGPIVDTLVLDRGVDRWRKGKRTLTAAAAHYGVPLSEDDAHASDADALASARIAWKIARRYPQVADMSLADLQTWQREVYVAWAENFGAYLARSGKTDDVERDWPMRGAS